MSYTVYNFKTKKALKATVALWHTFVIERPIDAMNASVPDQSVLMAPKPVRCFNPGLGPDLSNHTGTVYLEGPHYPQAHKWYASGEMKDGILVKVK
jgi:hypothetical protein